MNHDQPADSPTARFLRLLQKQHTATPGRDRQTIDAAKVTLVFAAMDLRPDLDRPPASDPAPAGGGPDPLPLRFERPGDCFAAARMCVELGSVLHAVVLTGVRLPEGFPPLQVVSILDELERADGAANPLLPANPFSALLPPNWRDTLARWQSVRGLACLAHGAACLAVHVYRALDLARSAGRTYLQEVRPASVAPGRTYAIGGVSLPTATETAIFAAQQACDEVRAAGLTDQRVVSSADLRRAWDWLLGRRLSDLLCPGDGGPAAVTAFLAAIDCERRSPPPPDVPPVATPYIQYVTLDQIAAMTNRSKKTLERHLHNPDSGRPRMPPPDVEGGGGKPHEWIWANVRPWLEATFSRFLPERFPTANRH